jgi:hypothetical protein
MKHRAWILPVAGSALAIALTACSENPAGPFTSAEARADLQIIAAKVKYLGTPDPDESMGYVDLEKQGADRRNAAICDLDAVTLDHGPEISDYGSKGEYWDTTTSYTAAGLPVCAENDETAYDSTHSYGKDSLAESWFRLRIDYPPTAEIYTGFFRISAAGTVRYFGGYTLEVASEKAELSFTYGLKDFSVSLVFEKGYTATLTPAPGLDMLREEPFPPTTVVMTGPIRKDGATVGYFEVMGDDGVVVKDASGTVIDSPG